jgi:hypothetical protein
MTKSYLIRKLDKALKIRIKVICLGFKKEFKTSWIASCKMRRKKK